MVQSAAIVEPLPTSPSFWAVFLAKAPLSEGHPCAFTLGLSHKSPLPIPNSPGGCRRLMGSPCLMLEDLSPVFGLLPCLIYVSGHCF